MHVSKYFVTEKVQTAKSCVIDEWKKTLNKMVIGKLNMSIGLMTVTPDDQLVLRWVACHMKRYVISWFFIRSLMFCVLQIWCSLLLNSSLYILEKEFHTLDSKVWKDMCQPKFAIYTVKSKMGPTILVFILLSLKWALQCF